MILRGRRALLGRAEAVAELTRELETHRRKLIGCCYRMLGSAFEAAKR
jgi:hypothetical protein